MFVKYDLYNYSDEWVEIISAGTIMGIEWGDIVWRCGGICIQLDTTWFSLAVSESGDLRRIYGDSNDFKWQSDAAISQYIHLSAN